MAESSENKQINIRVYFSHNYVESDLLLKDKNVVVIDVLRTSSTMAAGLHNGAKEIIPAADTATAGLIGRNSDGHSLLCGERNGKLIPGFQLGNSLKEYSEENVKGKILIFSSTNGTPALVKSKFASVCVISSFLNISRTADYINSLNKDFIILCSGTNGEPSLEDTVCAGMMISCITKKKSDKYKLSDSALISLKLYNIYKNNIPGMMYDSQHGKFLMSIGFEDDLSEAAKVDRYPVLPLMRNNLIRTLEGFETDPKLTMKRVSKNSQP